MQNSTDSKNFIQLSTGKFSMLATKWIGPENFFRLKLLRETWPIQTQQSALVNHKQAKRQTRRLYQENPRFQAPTIHLPFLGVRFAQNQRLVSPSDLGQKIETCFRPWVGPQQIPRWLTFTNKPMVATSKIVTRPCVPKSKWTELFGGATCWWSFSNGKMAMLTNPASESTLKSHC